MSSTTHSFAELGDNRASPLRPSSPFFGDNFRAGSRGSTEFFFRGSSNNEEDMPSLGLPSVPIAEETAAIAYPPNVFAQARDWDNDGISTLSVDETNTTDGTNPNQRPGAIIDNGHSATSTNTGTANARAPSAKNYSEFQYVLHSILEKGRHDDIIDWCEGGMAVLVTDVDRFTDEILRCDFARGRRPIKFSSFRKQLRRYGFRSETRHSYAKVSTLYFCNDNFQKGRHDLLKMMHPNDRKRKYTHV